MQCNYKMRHIYNTLNMIRFLQIKKDLWSRTDLITRKGMKTKDTQNKLITTASSRMHCHVKCNAAKVDYWTYPKHAGSELLTGDDSISRHPGTLHQCFWWISIWNHGKLTGPWLGSPRWMVTVSQIFLFRYHLLGAPSCLEPRPCKKEPKNFHHPLYFQTCRALIENKGNFWHRYVTEWKTSRIDDETWN